MNEKFTPGPWNVAGFDSRINEERYFGIGTPCGHGIGTPCGQMIVESFGECDSNRKANAALIAAAPELYSALKNLKELLENFFGKSEKDFFEDCDNGELYFAREYNDACNALKKARGES